VQARVVCSCDLLDAFTTRLGHPRDFRLFRDVEIFTGVSSTPDFVGIVFFLIIACRKLLIAVPMFWAPQAFHRERVFFFSFYTENFASTLNGGTVEPFEKNDLV
jgi:hypothetical protein